MRLIIMLSALLLLAGSCNQPGESDDASAVAGATDKPAMGQPDQTDEPAADQAKPAANEPLVPPDPPVIWPDWFPIYPDSDTFASKGIVDEFGTGLEAQLVSGDTPQNIIAYYHELVMAAGAHHRNTFVSPDRLVNTYIGISHDIVVDVTQLEGSAQILLVLQPAPSWEEEYPPLMHEWHQMGELPPGFPDDIITMMPGATINAGIVAGKELAVLDCLLPGSIDDAVDFYSRHFAALGWSEEFKSSSEIAYNVVFHKGDSIITAGIGQYADGTVFASLNMEPKH